jgi:uncharacterized lipoprotein YajG
MRVAAILPLLVLLTGCNRPSEETIDAVPPPTAQTANMLMDEAQRAADNAQGRSAPPPSVRPPTDHQGENE